MQRLHDIEDLKMRLRRTFRDDYNIQWSDSLLDEIIDEAQREYALYSGTLHGTMQIVAGKSAVLDCPDDFIRVVRVFGTDGKDLPIVSYRELARRYGDFRKKTADNIKCLVFDFDGHKKFRIFPQLPEGRSVGIMHYERLPGNGVLEVENIDAVEAYALYMMFLMTGKDLAGVWYEKFITLVNKDISAFNIAGNSQAIRSGRFF